MRKGIRGRINADRPLRGGQLPPESGVRPYGLAPPRHFGSFSLFHVPHSGRHASDEAALRLESAPVEDLSHMGADTEHSRAVAAAAAIRFIAMGRYLLTGHIARC